MRCLCAQVILRGLGNGLSAITYIMILLLLVFYLFAIGARPPRPGRLFSATTRTVCSETQ